MAETEPRFQPDMPVAPEVREAFEAQVKVIIGDYQAFFSGLLARLSEAGIDIKDRIISHICFRIDPSKYEEKREELKTVSRAYAEHEFGGKDAEGKDRSVAEFILKIPINLGNNHSTIMVELLPHKAGRSYTEGLENFGVLIGQELPAFKERYNITAVKHRPAVDIPFIEFDGKAVKFYHDSLKDMAEAGGASFVPIE